MPTREGVQFDVFVKGQRRDDLECLSIQRTAGGATLDTCQLAIVDRECVSGIALRDLSGEVLVIGQKIEHWGQLTGQDFRLSPSGDRRTLTSRVEPWHFGEALQFRWEYNRLTQAVDEEVWESTVFNPLIDGRIEPNRHPEKTHKDAHIFLDPESIRTEEGRAYHTGGKEAQLWKLSEAVHYLCWHLNPDETYVKNPDLGLLRATFGQFEPGDPKLQDVEIRMGAMLPQALDEILRPYGFSWYLNLESKDKRTIKFFPRGKSSDGNPRPVYYPAPRANLDPATANAPTAHLRMNLGAVQNDFWVLGARKQIECTFELVRAWPEDYDDADPDDLAKDQDGYWDTEHPWRQRAWRDWVLNEAGDYVGVRPSITAPADLKELLDLDTQPIPRRRRFLPTSTLGKDGAPIGDVRGVYVEWSDTSAVWNPLDEIVDCSCRLLTRECGIRFDGNLPPEQIMAAGVAAKVRVTAIIELDERLYYHHQSQQSPLLDFSPVIVNMSDRFFHRVIHEDSTFHADVAINAVRKSRSVDDAGAIKDYALRLANAWNMADENGTITIDGIAGEDYQIGNIIATIHGREIDLDAGEGRWPQVVGITIDPQKQTRVLRVETYRSPM